MVHVEPRPARKRVNARGSFVVPLVNAVRSALQDSRPMALPVPTAAEVWLRPRPKRDLLAERAHQLIDIDGLSYRGAEEKFRSEGVNINSGVVWQLYERYYEMIGQPKPKRPYNNDIPRESARRPAS